MTRIIFLFILLFTFSTPARAVKFSLVGAANFSEPEASPAAATYSAEMAFGGGALLEFGLAPSVGLEFGGLYVPREYDMTTTTAKVNTKLTMYQFPMVLKAYLANVLSIGVGGYYSSYKDEIKYRVISVNGVSNTTATTNASLHEKSDYGLVTSLGIYLPMTKFSRIIIDGRYNIGVKDNSTSIAQLKYTDIQMLAGIQFGF